MTQLALRPPHAPAVTLGSHVRKVSAVLIRPSSYVTKYGLVRRFKKAFIPSNSLNVLQGLTDQFFERLGVPTETHLFDDAIWRDHRRCTRLIKRLARQTTTKVIVMLVGVQTHELPRARAIAAQCNKLKNATVAIGGFHVSGMLRTLYDGIYDPRRSEFPEPNTTHLPPDIAELIAEDIIVFNGEAEGTAFGSMLTHILNGSARPLYREADSPDLFNIPLPEHPPKRTSHLITRLLPLDASRGCPFICSFCSIINVLGRTVRPRNPVAVVEYLKRVCRANGSGEFLFADDNFARNKHFRELLDGMGDAIAEGYRIHCTGELDSKAFARFPDLIEKLARAGFTSIMCGIESMNPDNFEDAAILKNDVAEYEAITNRLNEAGILVHALYMIGFGHDTPASVHHDIERLAELFDIATFFCTSPIPGSEDYARAVQNSTPMDADWNSYNSFQPVWDHPHMSREEWKQAYDRAWETFYSAAHVSRRIQRKNTLSQKVHLLGNTLLWRLAVFVYDVHPMVGGMGQKWSYGDQRPEAVPLPYPRWLPAPVAHRVDATCRRVGNLKRLITEVHYARTVLVESGLGAEILQEARTEFQGSVAGMWDWIKRTFGTHIGRKWLDEFWQEYGEQKWQLFWKAHWHACALPHAITELVYWARHTFGKRIQRDWLDNFWSDYKNQKWMLLLNPANIARHALVIPLAITEVAHYIKHTCVVLPRIIHAARQN